MNEGPELGQRLPALGPRGEGWVVLQFVALGLVVAGLPFGGAWTGLARSVAVGVGVGLLASGILLATAALLRLGPSLTPYPRPRSNARLVEEGIYAYVRHPIYGGLLLGCLGVSLIAASLLALGATAVVTLVLTLKSLREEAWLAARYEGYAAYRARTRRFLPGLV